MTIDIDRDGHLKWNTQDEYQRMEMSLALYQPRPEVVDAIIAAYNDPDWNWKKCDGCTGVSELHFPTGYRFPPCVMHDHICWLADQATTKKEQNRIRAHGDKLFFKANRDYGVSTVRAAGRWVGVRTWWFLTRWMHHVQDACTLDAP